MKSNSSPDRPLDWLERGGVPYIFRSLGMAVQPSKLAIALASIALTFLWGTFLDWCWSVRGGVPVDAIGHVAGEPPFLESSTPGTGSHGVFEVWREHSQRCVFGFVGSFVPKTSAALGTRVGDYLRDASATGPLHSLRAFAYGVWWMAWEHPLFFTVFGIGAMLVWALGGGAICRMAAVQFGRDEKLPLSHALRFSRDNLLGGLVLAPCIPLALAILVAILLVAHGLVLRIPVLGDVVAGLTFFLPLIGGCVVATLLIGLLAGGSLMWPAVAVESQDAFDAFSRSVSYTFSKPWKTILYALLATVFASLCWVFVHFFTYLSLVTTRTVVGFGTSPFGWWSRGTVEAPVRKLDLLWPLSGPGSLHAWPDWSALRGWEWISAAVIGIYVMLVVGLMFSFLASFYYCTSTVLYFLLRRDVDRTELDDVFMEDSVDLSREAVGAEIPKPVPSASGPASAQAPSVSLPVVGGEERNP